MILEYIIEDSKYKDLIKGKIPPKGKNGIIKVNSNLISNEEALKRSKEFSAKHKT